MGKIQSARLLIAWVVANFLGGFLVGFLEDNGLQFMATLFLSGAIAGTCQWVVLRRVLPSSRLWGWPLASALGWIAGMWFEVMVLGSWYDPVVQLLWQQLGLWEVFWLNLVTVPIWMLGMAIAQVLLLSNGRRNRSRVVGVWLLASVIGGAANGAVGAALCSAFCAPLPLALIGLVAGGGWAAYGLITGLALLWLCSVEEG